MSLLKVVDLAKSFAGTAALKGVTFEIEPGEIIGLVGENGAGKSTLIKILAGVHQADSGKIEWLGSSTQFRSPLLALRAGIATIHQELAYFEKLTVAENLLLGERWPRQFLGGTDWVALNRMASERLSACELQIEPERLFHTLSPAQRQEIAIARALSQNSKLIVLDEPTASLTEPEVERLMAHLNKLRKNGVALLYVSHRLDEILSLTDRVLVLRDGAMVSQFRTSETSIERIVRDMVGRDLSSAAIRTPSGAKARWCSPPRASLIRNCFQTSRLSSCWQISVLPG